MKLEIWSDVMCPFCYIGKRHLELALAQFEHRDAVEISWHSFQLDPHLQASPGTSVIAYLAARKGQSLAWAEQAHAHVTAMAREVGLDYRFDKAVVANSWDAHRILQLARTVGKDAIAEERLFRAYFTEGKDIADPVVLRVLGEEMGLDPVEVAAVLASERFADAVRADIALAQELGATGVPFFVWDRRIGVMGAQPPAALLQAMQRAYATTITAR